MGPLRGTLGRWYAAGAKEAIASARRPVLVRWGQIEYPSGSMTERPKLILASGSPYRRALLGRLGVAFETLVPTFEEVRLGDPNDTVRANAVGKARSVAVHQPNAAILASDQVAYCEGEIFEKPGTHDAACAQLGRLNGRAHTLHTCVLLRRPDGTEEEEIVIARLRIRSLSEEQISTYVRLEAPLDCAGSYKSEGLGIVLFDYLRCDDPTAIEGLPLISTRKLLERAGWKSFPPLTNGDRSC
jgi:septum formation protein